MPFSSRRLQFFRPTGQVVLTDQPSLQAVLRQGATVPHDSTFKNRGDKIRVFDGGGSAIAAPTASSNGATEFSVAVSGAGPWDVQVTWLGAGLSVLTPGTYPRTITITSAGATNSPLVIPVNLIVL